MEILSHPQSSSSPSLKKTITKMVVFIRSDLNMSIGKSAAQTAHAVLASFLAARSLSHHNPQIAQIFSKWITQGQYKQIKIVKDMLQLQEATKLSRNLQIITEQIIDAGRTQVEEGTMTVAAIGPWYSQVIDSILQCL